ncbi:DnaB-like dsDNA helicase [Mycobacterium phage Phrappuccino]|uniref:DnaB-like dsDNA helicase n=1 Tax=Mycobacterium phage Phrappuccino TaxID=2591223 RepID=A0A514DDV3_9CAUD|nr:DNA helicase [Mycobacterium phage Phrappuccino]QDH91788.1 DnaB-like dsDNA helicase [Mycobacterium phage Phrappuccino]QIQ63230.1 DnaB-like dsDNA helicase [Mycobacterium phage Settecandela]
MSEIERKLLTCLTDPAEIAKVYDLGLASEVFEEPMCRRAYDFIVGYWADNQMAMAPTRFVLEQELPGFRFEDNVEESVTWLAEKLRERWVTNQLQEMLTDAASHSVSDPYGTLKKLHQVAYDAAEAVAPRLTRSDMSNIDERRERYRNRSERPGGIGLPLGIDELDAHHGGVMPGEVVVVGAYSKVGKTMFLVNTATSLRKAGYTPIIFTLEMGISEIEDRIDAMFSGVSYNRFTKGDLHLDELQAWRTAQEQLHEMGGIHVESPEEGQRTVAQLANRARHVGADFLIIDQLSHMEPGKNTRDLKEHHGTIMKQMSVELSRPGKELPCLLAVQLSRDSLNPAEPISMKHFANAAEIEREADLLLALSRTGEERRNRMMKLHMLGSRRSDIKDWMLRWDLIDRTHISVLEEANA